MLSRPVETDADGQVAAARYAELVGAAQANDASFWAVTVRGQVFVRDDDFVARRQSRTEPARQVTGAIPKAQSGIARSRSQHQVARGGDRNAALCAAYRGGLFTMTPLAALARLSVSHVSRLIAVGQKLAKGET